MLMLLSPAKTLDFTPADPGLKTTRPALAKDAAVLAGIARTLSAGDLKRLMGVSDKLAELNVERFRTLKTTGAASGVPAALAFAGDVYHGLRARELGRSDLDWAQGRLRILSGLYGLLRPLDVIQPYRLEMGVRLQNPRGEALYDFWRETVTDALNAAAPLGDASVVNLASQEYFGAVDPARLKRRLVTCLFKEADEGGRLRTVAFFAKRARGAMVRFAIDGRVAHADGLKAFDRDGYRFDPAASQDDTWTFARHGRPRKAAGAVDA